jgi:hypothetical protein
VCQVIDALTPASRVTDALIMTAYIYFVLLFVIAAMINQISLIPIFLSEMRLCSRFSQLASESHKFEYEGQEHHKADEESALLTLDTNGTKPLLLCKLSQSTRAM